jgi:hypothetical protein
MKDKTGNDIIVSSNSMTPSINGTISNFVANGTEEGKSFSNKPGITANATINNSS